MVKYRPHRGSLADAMAEYKEFDSVDEMIHHIVHEWSGYISAEDISIGENQGADDRIGWKAWRYVLTSRVGDTNYDIPQCIGMCDLGGWGN